MTDQTVCFNIRMHHLHGSFLVTQSDIGTQAKQMHLQAFLPPDSFTIFGLLSKCLLHNQVPLLFWWQCFGRPCWSGRRLGR